MELLYLLAFAAGWFVCWLQYQRQLENQIAEQFAILASEKSESRKQLELQNQMLKSAFQELEQQHLKCQKQKSLSPEPPQFESHSIQLQNQTVQVVEYPQLVYRSQMEQVKPRYNNGEPGQ